MGEPKGFSLSNTGELRGCSSGVFAADDPGEAGRSSSGYRSASASMRDGSGVAVTASALDGQRLRAEREGSHKPIQALANGRGKQLQIAWKELGRKVQYMQGDGGKDSHQ